MRCCCRRTGFRWTVVPSAVIDRRRCNTSLPPLSIRRTCRCGLCTDITSPWDSCRSISVNNKKVYLNILPSRLWFKMTYTFESASFFAIPLTSSKHCSKHTTVRRRVPWPMENVQRSGCSGFNRSHVLCMRKRRKLLTAGNRSTLKNIKKLIKYWILKMLF